MLKTKKQKKIDHLEVEMDKVRSGLIYLKVLKQEEKFGLYSWRLNGKEKGMTNTFRGKNLISRLCLVY